MSTSRLRWFAAPLGLALLAYGCEAFTEPPPSPASIVMVSGDDQEGTAGRHLDDPFTVRVTDAAGEGVQGVEVTWSVTSGAGDLCPAPPACPLDPPLTSVSSRSLPGGAGRMHLRPTAVGTTRVSAEATGLQGSPVTFTANVTRLLILLSGVGFVEASDDDESPCLESGGDGFIGPDGTNHADVPVGTTVIWDLARGTCAFHIVSTSAPPGGKHFDSAMFPVGVNDHPLEFVPEVPGTWEYVDEISGATGTLTAR